MVQSKDEMKNETSVECCPKCGNKEFAVARDMKSTAETCDRLDLAHENEKLREVLEKIAATDTSPSVPDFLWLQRWRNETKDAASKALKGEK